MAKYDPAFLKSILDADEFDVLEVEFIARGAEKVAGAGAVIHDCQEQTLQTNGRIQFELDDRNKPADDRWRVMCLDSAEVTMQAQGRMQNALGSISEALAHRIKRA